MGFACGQGGVARRCIGRGSGVHVPVGLSWARAQARACDPEGAVVDEATGTGGDAEARLWWEAVRGSSWIILAQKRVRLVQHEESNASEEHKKGNMFASFGRHVVRQSLCACVW